MFKPYRRPTVLVLGGGAAGCTAAAECGVSSYRTTLVEKTDRLGGRHAAPSAPTPSPGTALHTPYLRGDGTDGSATSLCRQLTDAVSAPAMTATGYPPVTVLTGTTAVDATFDTMTGYWLVTVSTRGADDSDGDSGDSATRVLRADVLIRATGDGTPTIGHSRRTVGDAPLHQGIQPVGFPNLLLLDTPEPPGLLRPRRPLDIVEARADHCRRYVRQLEIRGPGAMTVDSASWAAQKSTRRAAVNDLHTVHTTALRFTPATAVGDPTTTRRRAS
jgi:hypothetical protein